MRYHYHRRSSSPHRQTVIALSVPPFVRLGCLIVAVSFLSFSFFVWVTSTPPTKVSSPAEIDSHQISSHYDGFSTSLRKRNVQNNIVNFGSSHFHHSSSHRLAIIIPFIGQDSTAIPSYLELFCVCAAGSANLVDFLLIHDGVLDGFYAQGDESICPKNVIFISLENIEGFSRALVRVMDYKADEDIPSIVGGSKDKLAHILANHILKYPYVMVEFKPALGHIFADYLKGYSHWGYSDLDILFGDLERWITPDELNDFDIVTYGFGDQEHLYLRGQFTFHRNDPEKINQLWRHCKYLSKMDERFADVISGDEHLHFESAEGCYSAAVLENTDIKVKYAVKAFTDVKGKDTAYSHGLYVSTGKKKDKTIIYKAGQEDPTALAGIPENWFETRGSVYGNPKVLLYKPVGERIRLPVVQKEDVKCMYWAQKRYQSRLCIDDVASTDTVYWIDGKLYKEKYELTRLPAGITTAPFFHFQEWKRYYRTSQLGGFSRNGPSTSFVLSKEGVLPILPTRYPEIASSGSHVILKPKDKDIAIPSPLGLNLITWHGIHNSDRSQLPYSYYCLRSGPKERPGSAPTPHCQFMTSWRDSDTVEILSGASAWNRLDVHSEVTLALTLQIHSEQLDKPYAIQGFLNLLTIYLDRWQGQPCVIVIHIASATPEIATLFREKLGAGSDLSYYGLENALVAAIFTTSSDIFSRKALMNMAIDAAPTRWVTSGYELERGIVMSQDTTFIAHRTAQIQKSLPGSVHIIPQFGLVEGDHDFSVGALELAYLDGQLSSLEDLEEGECEGSDDDVQNVEDNTIFVQIEKLWWELTRRLTKESPLLVEERAIEQQALALDRIQLALQSLLTQKQHYNLYATDASPIILFDNLGPRNGMLTSEMVREVEEFGGKLCYNSLRLAQMATFGYRVNVLAGSFGISTPVTRHVIGDPSRGALGVSRCDGCFFFYDEEQEDILEGISLDERTRPAKIAILWEKTASDPLHGHA